MYDKIIITIVPSYTGKNITHLLPVALLLMLCTRNNTDSNKLVIFPGIALYYGDNYIVLPEILAIFKLGGWPQTDCKKYWWNLTLAMVSSSPLIKERCHFRLRYLNKQIKNRQLATIEPATCTACVEGHQMRPRVQLHATRHYAFHAK